MRAGAGSSGDGAIIQGGNTALVQASGADAVANAAAALLVNSRLAGFNGTTWDRMVSGADNADAVAAAALGRLLVAARLTGFDGTNWSRVRNLGTVSLNGLGQLCVATAIPGAGVVTTRRYTMVADASVRATVYTPTAGKRVRIISVSWLSDGGVDESLEVYFGTGANIGTTAGKEITEALTAISRTNNLSVTWPDGAGPVGAVDDVVSARMGSNQTGRRLIIAFREE